MKRHYGRHLIAQQKKILDQFIKDNFNNIRRGFNLYDYPKLLQKLEDIHIWEDMDSAITRYVDDKVSDMTRVGLANPYIDYQLNRENIDKFATEEEKAFLKEYGEKSLQKHFENEKSHVGAKNKGAEAKDKGWARGYKDGYQKKDFNDGFEGEGSIKEIFYYQKGYAEGFEEGKDDRKTEDSLTEIQYDEFGDEIKDYPDYDPSERFRESKQLTEKWQARLHDVYNNNYEEFKLYAEMYGLVERLGYESAHEAWSENPMISGSVEPGDYKKVKESKQLKESLADQRAEEFIKQSENDLDIWEEMVSYMTPEERKEAAFEFKSAIRGMVSYRRGWKIKDRFLGDESKKYWDEIKERRLLYTRYLNRLKKYLRESKQLTERFVDQSEHEEFERMMRGPKKAFAMLHLYQDCITDTEFRRRAKEAGYTPKQIAKLLSLQESKQLTEAKNTKAKTRKVDDPYETYTGSGPLADWEWRVLKHYQSPDKEKENPYARVFCAVKSPMTYGDWEYGDTYCRDIPGFKYDSDQDLPDFSKGIDSKRVKNLSDDEVDMIGKMFSKAEEKTSGLKPKTRNQVALIKHFGPDLSDEMVDAILDMSEEEVIRYLEALGIPHM
jgi:hypothetical protein